MYHEDAFVGTRHLQREGTSLSFFLLSEYLGVLLLTSLKVEGISGWEVSKEAAFASETAILVTNNSDMRRNSLNKEFKVCR
ncbi:hypothetical protein TNCV_4542431 [Trichonephila clavipes]|nr:hypothetical protein TNCV_4542431 [Trichonephila clavipes]